MEHVPAEIARAAAENDFSGTIRMDAMSFGRQNPVWRQPLRDSLTQLGTSTWSTHPQLAFRMAPKVGAASLR